MTSSLVGSEMCIRDRPETVFQTLDMGSLDWYCPCCATKVCPGNVDRLLICLLYTSDAADDM
eukprot:7874428-Prorocentrum_lima.AAC.1